jgi:hypothetical protein
MIGYGEWKKRWQLGTAQYSEDTITELLCREISNSHAAKPLTMKIQINTTITPPNQIREWTFQNSSGGYNNYRLPILFYNNLNRKKYPRNYNEFENNIWFQYSDTWKASNTYSYGQNFENNIIIN